MTTKIEARRFRGKPGTWNHYAMAVKAHFAVAKISKFFNDGSSIAAAQREAWKEAQLEIYNHFVLTCDDRAATTLEAIDTTQDAVGWNTFLLLQSKYGDAKRAQLSKLVRKFLKRKQGDDEPVQDYLTDMRAKLSQIEKYPAQQLWDVMKTSAVVIGLKNDPETKLTKKLVTNRMAEAETEGKTLTYDQVEGIIENDQGDEEEKPKKPKKPDTDTDLAMWLNKGGKGGGKGLGKGGGKGSAKGGGAGWHQP